MGNCDADIDYEVNRVIDEILREDRLESIASNPCADSCEATCEVRVEENGEQPTKNCAVETSARFSIRILEALRAVQRQKSGCTWASSTMKELVQYIRTHYNYDGDLCSQVETALNQVTRQGFVLRMEANRYRLVGPFACSVLNPPALRRGCSKNRRNSSVGRTSRCGTRTRPCTPIANSTFAAPDCPDPASMDPSATLSDVEDNSQRSGFQNGSNRERSLIRGIDPHPFNEDQELSILRNIPAPGPMRPVRPGGNGEEVIQNRNVDEIDEEIDVPLLPNRPILRPGGNARVRVIRDHSVDEVEQEIDPPGLVEPFGRPAACRDCEQGPNDQSCEEVVGEIDPLDPDVGMQRPGPCGQVVREHSSDENMYREEPSMNVTRERRRCRHSRRRRRRRSRDNLICRSAARRCPRNNSNCGSEADVSDDTTDDERHGVKPWVRRCQKEDDQIFNRRHRRCSSCAYD